MRRLLLLRHAAAAKSAAGDRERQLTPEGRRAVGSLGARLRDRASPPPDLVLCSPAIRTRETLELVENAWATLPQAVYEETLYVTDAASLLLRLRTVAPEVGSVLLVGHNPSLEELTRMLAGRGGQSLSAGLPPAGLAVFDISTPWPALSPAGARLVELLVPGP